MKKNDKAIISRSASRPGRERARVVMLDRDTLEQAGLLEHSEQELQAVLEFLAGERVILKICDRKPKP